MTPQPPPPPIDPLIRNRPSTAVPPPPLTSVPPQRPLPPTGAATPARPHVAAAPVGTTARRPDGTPSRRRRPVARRSKVASVALSITATVGLTAAFARHGIDDEVAAGGADTTDGTGTGPEPGSVGAAGSPSAVGATVTTVPQGGAATPSVTILDGTYTGDTFTNRWGPVQVQVVYAAGTITDVVVLRYPDGDRKSVSINQRALPRLEASTIAAQGSAISRVSGATYTWRSYRQSLQSAIDAAISASGSVG